MAAKIQTLPTTLFKTLTWDRGTEMARHREFSIDTGVQVFFATPTRHGNAVPTKTPTACSVNTCPKAPTSPLTAQPTSTSSLLASTTDPARHSTGTPPPKPSNNFLRPLF